MLNVDKGGRPDCAVNTVGAAASTAPGPARDTGGDCGVVLAPSQQAANIVVIDDNVTGCLVTQYHGSLDGVQKAVRKPCKNGLGTGETPKSAKEEEKDEESQGMGN